MTDTQSRCLDAFPQWLRSLADDARVVADVLEDRGVPEPARRQLAGALNYLFKSLDLIPDGIEDLGFIDDAFVFRVAAEKAVAVAGDADAINKLSQLASQAALIRDFLGDDYGRLATYVAALTRGSVRGRSVDDISSDARVANELLSEVRAWATSYVAPSFSRDEKNLVKLRSFLTAKLPA